MAAIAGLCKVWEQKCMIKPWRHFSFPETFCSLQTFHRGKPPLKIDSRDVQKASASFFKCPPKLSQLTSQAPPVTVILTNPLTPYSHGGPSSPFSLSPKAKSCIQTKNQRELWLPSRPAHISAVGLRAKTATTIPEGTQ